MATTKSKVSKNTTPKSTATKTTTAAKEKEVVTTDRLCRSAVQQKYRLFRQFFRTK